MTRTKVAVLMGGRSSERAVSLSSGRQVMAALDPLKYDVIGLDAAGIGPASHPLPPVAPAQDGHGSALVAPADIVALSGTASPGSDQRPDVVFIALHGRGGEDGTVQGLLEVLRLPYTGSGVLASALAMDKARTKRVLRAEGVPVPDDMVLRATARPAPGAAEQAASAAVGFPCIVKPNTEGSTVGCTIVREAGQLADALDEAFAHDTTVIVEQFVAGTEITVGLLGNDEPQALPIIEIVPKGEFYDYESKYAEGGSQHIIPARISESAAERARDYAVRAHRLLGCRGMSRVDMIVAGDQPYVLEVNTIPGMTPTSLLPDAARAAGISFSDLLDRIIRMALEPQVRGPGRRAAA